MHYFTSLTQQDIIKLVTSTKKNLFLSLPSFHKELADAITILYDKTNSNDIGIHILVDFDAQTFRQGYGDFPSIDKMIKRGIKVRSLDDNRISFIIADNIGYYLFIESRSLIPADKETFNAVHIDPVSIVRLKKFFFNDVTKMNYEDEIANAIVKESSNLDKTEYLLGIPVAKVEDLVERKIEIVADNLRKNPPLNPDYKRLVEFYSNRFQYIKLKFEGANLQQRKIKLPPKALPIADANLKKRLETKLNLFDSNNSDAAFPALQDLKKKVLEIREKFLKKVKSRDESLLNKNRKSDFQTAIDNLKINIKETKSKTLTQIADQISLTKKQLLFDLIDFFKANPTALFPDHNDLWENNTDYIESFAKSKAEEIIYRIKWPEAHSLVDEFKLDIQYSDITYEDLKNKDFISDLKTSGLIGLEDENHLAEFGLAIEAKR